MCPDELETHETSWQERFDASFEQHKSCDDEIAKAFRENHTSCDYDNEYNACREVFEKLIASTEVSDELEKVAKTVIAGSFFHVACPFEVWKVLSKRTADRIDIFALWEDLGIDLNNAFEAYEKLEKGLATIYNRLNEHAPETHFTIKYLIHRICLGKQDKYKDFRFQNNGETWSIYSVLPGRRIADPGSQEIGTFKSDILKKLIKSVSTKTTDIDQLNKVARGHIFHLWEEIENGKFPQSMCWADEPHLKKDNTSNNTSQIQDKTYITTDDAKQLIKDMKLSIPSDSMIQKHLTQFSKDHEGQTVENSDKHIILTTDEKSDLPSEERWPDGCKKLYHRETLEVYFKNNYGSEQIT